MNAQAMLSIGRRAVAAAGFILVVPLSVLAADSAAPQALSVTVLPDAYVTSGQSFDTVAALEAWATPGRGRSLSLDGCGPASTGPLLAAAERLHRSYADGVRIRAFAAGEAACVEAASRFGTPLPHYAGDPSGRSAVH